MDLMARLRIVKRANSESSMIAVLKAIHVYDGRMQSSDGRIVIDVACPELKDMTFSVNGTKFVKAVEACNGSPDNLEVTDTALNIKRAKFKAKLPLLGDEFPRTELAYDSEQWKELPAPLIPLLKAIKPFIGVDASRPWCCGVLFTQSGAYATNNTVVVESDYCMPDVFNLPSFAVDEIISIGLEPRRIAILDNHVTLDFGTFMFRTQLLPSDWPSLTSMLEPANAELPEVPSGLNMAVSQVVDFCPDSDFQCIVLAEGKVTTTEGEISAEVEGFDVPQGRYRAVVLQSVLDHATHVDFSHYPAPVPFRTDFGLRGVFVGVRL